MLKAGDRVRFLNSVGGGVVRGFQSKDIVLVEEEDGFETPVLLRECVIVDAVNKESNLPEINKPVEFKIQNPDSVIPEDEQEDEFRSEETDEGEKLSVYLAFLPHNMKALQTTGYDLYLINDSNYFLYYTISGSTPEGQKLHEKGKIEPNIRLFLKELEKTQLNEWAEIHVQALPFKTKQYVCKPAIDVLIKVHLVKFYKLHSFTENDYFDEPAMLLPVIESDIISVKSDINIEIQPKISAKKTEKRHRPRIENTFVKKNDIVEVDLHIDALLETTAGMNNADILGFQMDTFQKVIEQYKNNKGQKIVFIHGKGEGVLRKELLKQLRTKYSGYFVQDASFAEYGFGATMITIK